MDGSTSFNPLDRIELGKSVGNALLRNPCEPLPPTSKFPGAGLYAIYYQGSFQAYAPISAPGCVWPIYVGKAMPQGGRKGVAVASTGAAQIFKRLGEHAKSIASAKNLSPDDFRCRWLVVDDVWIPLAERILIQHYLPLWNVIVDGFGIHDPGGKPGGTTGRAGQKMSPWDALHPGRGFAAGRPPSTTADALEQRIAKHFGDHPPRITTEPTLTLEDTETPNG